MVQYHGAGFHHACRLIQEGALFGAQHIVAAGGVVLEADQIARVAEGGVDHAVSGKVVRGVEQDHGDHRGEQARKNCGNGQGARVG